MEHKIASLFLTIIFISVIVIHFNCSDESTNEKAMTPEEQIKLGEYNVATRGCIECHSPKKMTEMGLEVDEALFLSGHPSNSSLPRIDTALIGPGKWNLVTNDRTAWVGPWGVSFAANLTPDGPTGLGNWTEEIFIKAMRTGKNMGIGRQILPPMPWKHVAKLKDEDIKSIFAYLKSLKPIRNQVPDPILPNELSKLIAVKK